MVDDPEGPRPVVVGHVIGHVIGGKLDDLSVRDFDDRILSLRQEIARLELAKQQKQVALDSAGLIFKAVVPKS